jgi:hypothetical protein
MEKNFKDTEFRNRKDKEDETKKALESKQWELNQKETDIKELMAQF